MSEYIDRKAFIEVVKDIPMWGSMAVMFADSIPAADVAPVVHGRWIERQTPHAMGGVSGKCSVCAKSVQYLGNPLNYCPNCGAKMDGGTKNASKEM